MRMTRRREYEAGLKTKNPRRVVRGSRGELGTRKRQEPKHGQQLGTLSGFEVGWQPKLRVETIHGATAWKKVKK